MTQGLSLNIGGGNKSIYEIIIRTQGTDEAKRDFNALTTSSILTTSSALTLVDTFKNLTLQARQFAIDFEYSFSKLATISDEVAQDTQAYSEQLRDFVNNELGNLITQTEAARLQYEALSAGLQSLKEAEAATAAAVRLGTAGFVDRREGINLLTTFYANYGDTLTEATTAEEKFAAINDRLIVAQNQGKFVIGDVADKLGRVVPNAKAAGVSLEDVLTAFSLLTAEGVESTTAVAGLNNVLNSIMKPTGDAKKALGELNNARSSLGKDPVDLKKVLNTQGFTGIAKVMEEAFATPGISSNLVERIFGDQTGRTAINVLKDNVEQLNKNLAQSESSAGKAEDAFNKMAGTAKIQFAAVLNKAKDLMVDIGEGVTASWKPLLDILESILDGFSALPDPMKSATGVMLGLTVAVGGLTVGLAGLIAGIKALHEVKRYVNDNINQINDEYIDGKEPTPQTILPEVGTVDEEEDKKRRQQEIEEAQARAEDERRYPSERRESTYTNPTPSRRTEVTRRRRSGDTTGNEFVDFADEFNQELPNEQFNDPAGRRQKRRRQRQLPEVETVESGGDQPEQVVSNQRNYNRENRAARRRRSGTQAPRNLPNPYPRGAQRITRDGNIEILNPDGTVARSVQTSTAFRRQIGLTPRRLGGVVPVGEYLTPIESRRPGILTDFRNFLRQDVGLSSLTRGIESARTGFDKFRVVAGNAGKAVKGFMGTVMPLTAELLLIPAAIGAVTAAFTALNDGLDENKKKLQQTRAENKKLREEMGQKPSKPSSENTGVTDFNIWEPSSWFGAPDTDAQGIGKLNPFTWGKGKARRQRSERAIYLEEEVGAETQSVFSSAMEQVNQLRSGAFSSRDEAKEQSDKTRQQLENQLGQIDFEIGQLDASKLGDQAYAAMKSQLEGQKQNLKSAMDLLNKSVDEYNAKITAATANTSELAKSFTFVTQEEKERIEGDLARIDSINKEYDAEIEQVKLLGAVKKKTEEEVATEVLELENKKAQAKINYISEVLKQDNLSTEMRKQLEIELAKTQRDMAERNLQHYISVIERKTKLTEAQYEATKAYLEHQEATVNGISSGDIDAEETRQAIKFQRQKQELAKQKLENESLSDEDRISSQLDLARAEAEIAKNEKKLLDDRLQNDKFYLEQRHKFRLDYIYINYKDEQEAIDASYNENKQYYQNLIDLDKSRLEDERLTAEEIIAFKTGIQDAEREIVELDIQYAEEKRALFEQELHSREILISSIRRQAEEGSLSQIEAENAVFAIQQDNFSKRIEWTNSELKKHKDSSKQRTELEKELNETLEAQAQSLFEYRTNLLDKYIEKLKTGQDIVTSVGELARESLTVDSSGVSGLTSYFSGAGNLLDEIASQAEKAKELRDDFNTNYANKPLDTPEAKKAYKDAIEATNTQNKFLAIRNELLSELAQAGINIKLTQDQQVNNERIQLALSLATLEAKKAELEIQREQYNLELRLRQIEQQGIISENETKLKSGTLNENEQAIAKTAIDIANQKLSLLAKENAIKQQSFNREQQLLGIEERMQYIQNPRAAKGVSVDIQTPTGQISPNGRIQTEDSGVSSQSYNTEKAFVSLADKFEIVNKTIQDNFAAVMLKVSTVSTEYVTGVTPLFNQQLGAIQQGNNLLSSLGNTGLNQVSATQGLTNTVTTGLAGISNGLNNLPGAIGAAVAGAIPRQVSGTSFSSR